jgi:hypothetical protein
MVSPPKNQWRVLLRQSGIGAKMDRGLRYSMKSDVESAPIW